MMEKFRNMYEGQTIWIVGKGPSLQYLTKEHIGLGPVITINEAIIKVEEIDLPNPIYSMQKDGGNRRRYYNSYPLILKPDCDYTPNCGDKCGNMCRPKKGATLLVHKHESLYCFPDYSPRYVFDWQNLGLHCNQFSQIMAIKIGMVMGCKNFHFISFDAHVNGCFDSYVPNIGITRVDHGFKNHVQRIKRHIKNLDCEWITPRKGKAIAFITRVKPRRFKMLTICKNSIKKQTNDDYIHIICRDDKTKSGYGMLLANQSLAKISPIDAQYVMVIDDDDMIIDSDFVKLFKKIVDNNNPEIVFFKGIVFGREIPSANLWEKCPVRDKISGSCFAVRIDIWEKYVHKYGKERCGDYSFISECYKNTKNHFWFNHTVFKTQRMRVT